MGEHLLEVMASSKGCGAVLAQQDRLDLLVTSMYALHNFFCRITVQHQNLAGNDGAKGGLENIGCVLVGISSLRHSSLFLLQLKHLYLL